MYEWAEVRDFRYLLKILEKGGFRAAAEELYTSQPNLTVQARQFQDRASVRLFRKLKVDRFARLKPGLRSLSWHVYCSKFVMKLSRRSSQSNAARSTLFSSTPLVDEKLFRSFCGLKNAASPLFSYLFNGAQWRR
jgi:hypothetical protein